MHRNFPETLYRRNLYNDILYIYYSYNNIEIALNCGNMLRECIKHESLAK